VQFPEVWPNQTMKAEIMLNNKDFVLVQLLMNDIPLGRLAFLPARRVSFMIILASVIHQFSFAELQ
jgi:hypothetical protein